MNWKVIFGTTIATVILITLVLYFYTPISPSHSYTLTPDVTMGEIVKITSQDFAPPGKIEIYFISWYGCPNGATSSWALYLLLQKYGIVEVQPHSSKFDIKIGSAIPGLIFLNYTPKSNVIFHFLYLYNQYLNETTTGIPINISTYQAVYYGLQMIKSSMPQWVYNIVYYYEIESKLVNAGNGSVAFYAHHLVTICIITGPKGTWMFILYPNPLTPLGILKDLNATSLTPSQAVKEASNLLNEINKEIVPQNILQAEENLNEIITEEIG